MNARHSGVTDWGLSHVSVAEHETVLDVGCGGGRTIHKLAALTRAGKVHGIDYSQASLAVAKQTNREYIADGRVELREASVSELPFPNEMFDLVTAVETHFWWPDLPAGMREILRVLKRGGRLIVIAEVYRGAPSAVSRLVEKQQPKTSMTLLTVDEHRELFAKAGFANIEIRTEPPRGWICCVGGKP